MYLVLFGDQSTWSGKKTHLSQESTDPDSNENWISIETLEDVSLPVYFASVYFVEQGHHYKRVEDYRKMLSRRGV